MGTRQSASHWRGADMMSKGGYTVTANTGCSDWEAQQIGELGTATSDLDCLNKCLDISGAAYANFKSDACDDATLGAHSGACYCFSGCTMVKINAGISFRRRWQVRTLQLAMSALLALCLSPSLRALQQLLPLVFAEAQTEANRGSALPRAGKRQLWRPPRGNPVGEIVVVDKKW